jgi:hypothetical protein
MKWWPIFILATCFVLFLPNYKESEAPELIELENGCMVYSLHHQMVIQSNEMLEPFIWSRVLAIHFNKKLGHAVNVFVYKNYTYIYDPNIGSYPLYSRPIYDPLQLAEILYPDIPIKKAYFLEPTLLLQYQMNPSTMQTNARIY